MPEQRDRKKPYRDYSDDTWFTRLVGILKWDSTGCCWWRMAGLVAGALLLGYLLRLF